MHEIGTEDGDVLLKTSKHRLAYTKCLDGLFVGSGKEMLVLKHGEAKDVAKGMGEGKVHGNDPFQMQPALC